MHACTVLVTCGDNGRGEFILLYMLAYAFTVPITFLTYIMMKPEIPAGLTLLV
jgi:hypothetical protein